jgi:uncharacterized protein
MLRPVTARTALCHVEATNPAREALAALRAEHGELALHLPGGAEDAGTPVCLLAGELRIGAQDLYLGTVAGVDLFEQACLPGRHYRTGWTVTLDLVPGYPPGFSLIPREGMRFAIRDSRGVGSGPEGHSVRSSP